MLFTITIDCKKDGSLEFWTQKKERLAPEQERKFEALKKKVEQLIKHQNTKQLELTE